MTLERRTPRHQAKNRLKKPVLTRVDNETGILEAAMTRFSAISALAALVLAATALPASAPAAAKSNFDGTWSVLIVTQKGTCDRAYRYPVKIDNGSVGYAGDAAFTVSGKVGENGAVIVKVARGSQSANGSGRLSPSGGSGMWTAGSGECSGTWTAERRS
jgi:murein DD-endopeptidase MepM/ murein hydrolase activator NlpD